MDNTPSQPQAPSFHLIETEIRAALMSEEEAGQQLETAIELKDRYGRRYWQTEVERRQFVMGNPDWVRSMLNEIDLLRRVLEGRLAGSDRRPKRKSARQEVSTT